MGEKEDARICIGYCSHCGTPLGLTPHIRRMFEAGADFVEARCPSCKKHTLTKMPPKHGRQRP